MDWPFVAISALTLACIYGLLALGVSIVFSSLGMINMAHGLSFALAGYGAWLAAQGMALTWRGGGNPAEA